MRPMSFCHKYDVQSGNEATVTRTSGAFMVLKTRSEMYSVVATVIVANKGGGSALHII